VNASGPSSMVVDGAPATLKLCSWPLVEVSSVAEVDVAAVVDVAGVEVEVAAVDDEARVVEVAGAEVELCREVEVEERWLVDVEPCPAEDVEDVEEPDELGPAEAAAASCTARTKLARVATASSFLVVLDMRHTPVGGQRGPARWTLGLPDEGPAVRTGGGEAGVDLRSLWSTNRSGQPASPPDLLFRIIA